MISPIAAAALFLFVLLPGTALGCSCADLSRANPARLKEYVAQAERVVHARVSQIVSPHEARIEVLESFKGEGRTLEAKPGNEANCGISFRRGEEYVYFVFGGAVNLCGRAPPAPALIAGLRNLKVGEGSACDGVPRPPRPERVPAPKDEEAYEPLNGADPELVLGRGHVWPVREGDRDDWTRRILLPVFASPNGELKLWLTPGSLGSDALVETGYETTSFIALQVLENGWVQIRFGGPLASGAGWVHRCHLETATPPLEYEPWEKRFVGRAIGPLYFRSWSPHDLRDAPSASAAVVARIPADPNVYGMEVLEFRGDWARVRVSTPSTHCAYPKPRRSALREGWVRWKSRELGPALWYYTRGC